MDMRKKSQSWLVPLVILFVVFWAISKKDTPPAKVPPNKQPTPNALISAPLPAIQPVQSVPVDQFVNADRLNLRNQPGGKVISTLKRGDRIQVFEKKNDWVRISVDGQPAKWLSSKSLCDGANCYAVSKQEPVRQTRPAPQPIPRQTPSYGSSCPCSCGNVCIGLEAVGTASLLGGTNVTVFDSISITAHQS
ncbi:SH3 domain-containing protein [Pseudomonas sp. Wu6]|uniref:SH3 domain-containing protein n=1 Tax=Pseudomonas sp. Wu6 TaxID=1210129 RepID=UPI00325FBD71